MQRIIVDNRICNIVMKGEKSPVFLYINSPSIPVGACQITEAIEKLSSNYGYIFIELLISDWDKNLSPWPVKSNNRDFSGKALPTLNWILDNLIPYINNNYKDHREIYIAGYSLGGLFALWSLYKSDIFGGAVCCSGSLWYPQWDKFIKENNLLKKSLIYLSLGGKEEKTKNPLMASVGEKTRNQLKILKNNSQIKSVTLEMNPGGHFADTATRVAKGIYWIMKQIIEK